ncbi:MAG: YbaB/EbfC family nucleoid-associated protein [Streptosporangiaceae bacterium]
MQQLLAAAAAMQSQLMNAQQELADTEVEGTAGGGLVKATVNGQGELVDVTIDAAAIDSSDPQESAQTLADLVLAAYRDACRSVDELQEQTMAPFAAGFGGAGLGGTSLPDLTGIPGLSGLPGLSGRPEPPDDEPADAADDEN